MAERAVAALQSCFGALPADTVPAVVDCVLASSLESSPSQLFSVLLDPSKVCFLLLGCLLNAKSPSKKKRKKKKKINAQLIISFLARSSSRTFMPPFPTPPRCVICSSDSVAIFLLLEGLICFCFRMLLLVS
jgi:hypothetical protein